MKKTLKTTISITLDTDVVELARAKQVNISGICNEYLREYLNVDEDLLPSKKELLEQELIEFKAKSNIVKRKLAIIEETEEKLKEEKLKAHEEREQKIKEGRIEVIDD